MTIPKYSDQLPIPADLQPTAVACPQDAGGCDDYTITMAQTTQQMLPANIATPYPTTNIFAYSATPVGGGTYAAAPGGTIKATRGRTVRVNWVNSLTTFDYPFMPVDPTLDWANPNSFVVPTGSFLLFPPGYPQAQSPVPAVPTLHGGEVSSFSAGGPNQWFTSSIGVRGPGLTLGTNYTLPNIANFVYPNGQQASTLWYHDNAEGVSRLNQYSGLQGFYEISDPGDPIEPQLPSGAQDIPLAIQDAMFNVDGTLAYPLGGLNPQVHPYWMGEFYGDIIMVNGKVWPNLNVDPRVYRFRILNSSQNRTMLLNLNNGQSFTQIASDGGYLPNPVLTTSLSLSPGERAEILIDFSGQAAGTQIILENTGLAGLLAPNPDTNGQVMRFTVSGATPVAPGNLPFTLNNMPALTSDSPTRTMTLHDAVSAQTGATLGFYINGQPMSAVTDILPAVGSTETWEVINTGLTPVSLHLPLVQARLLNRELYDSISYLTAWELANGVDPLLGLQGPLPGATVPVSVGPYLLPPVEAPLPEELGWKDTISIFPLEVTRIQVRYAPQDAVGAAPNVNNLFPFDATAGPGYWLQSGWPSASDNQMSRPMQLNATAPILSMTKTVSDVPSGNGDGQAQPGETLTYTITVTNNGPVASQANNVVVTDIGPNDTAAQTPAGPYLLGSIAGGGASAQQIYTVTVNNPLAFSTQTINNTATATADNHLPVTASASIATAQLPPILGLAKSVSDDNGDLIAQPGELLTYTLTVTNTGPGNATGVTITDAGPNNSSAPSPAGPYVIGTVNAGTNTTRTYTVTVNASVPGTVAAINNSATLTADNHVPVNAMATIRNATSDLSPLSPLAIPKYVDQLVKPPDWTPTTTDPDGTEVYDISMERFQQQILPSQFPATTVFGYSGTTAGGPFQNSPSGTFEATRGTPVRVNWTNNLESQFLPVDPTIHWADPLNLGMVMPPFDAWPPGYPEAQDIVPAVTHLHGGEVQSDDDGGPESWITGEDITGPEILGPGVVAANHTARNTLTTNYPNSQDGTTLWYHDHAMGATRINVMSGLAGFYLLRDPADSIAASLPSGDYELPIAIQDRQFNTDGTFSYPLGGPNPAIHPYWVPEFLGDTIMVNGKTWPNKNVEPHQYRLRLLNGSNARFYTLGFSNGMSFTQIGTDGGYLPHPITSTFLTIAPGERADLLVDFSGVPAGTQIILTNTAPAPFPLGALPDPNTTGQIMRFTVNAVAPVTPPALPFNLATIPVLTPDSPTRTLTLNEAMNLTTGAPVGVFLNGQPFNGAITETPVMGSTEEWDIVNLTADAHPIHLHLVQFQIMNRELINSFAYAFNWDLANGNDPSMGLMAPLDHPTVGIPVTPYLIPNPTPPMVNEQGWKDTIQVPPGMVTRIKVRFAPQDAVLPAPGVNPYTFDPTFGPGYVWHCHILEHEDNEMMRPMTIAAGDPGKSYYWPWYDSVNMMDWVLAGNPDGAANLTFDLSIGGVAQTLPDQFGAGIGVVPGGRTMFYSTPGTINGPVIASSTTTGSAVASQRTLMGSSFDEVLGTEKSRLSDHYYWTWYDMFNAGFANWVIVANPSATETVAVDVTFNDISTGSPVPVSDTREIPPGQVRQLTFPGKMGGPVELKARVAGGFWPADARDVVASQRVTTNGGTAHNEEPGIPASELTTDYVWNWYDMMSPGFANWVLVSNPGATPVTYQVLIAGTAMDLGAYGNPGDATTGTLAAGEIDTPTFPGQRNGPVEVISTGGNVISSQRVIAGPSFEETPGYPRTALSSTYHWTWYDMMTPGSVNWVLITNPAPVNPVYYEVKIAGVVRTSGTILAGQNATPTFNTIIGGPVQVDAWTDSGKGTPANVIASQRVLWNGYFNEVQGTVLN